MPRLTLTNPRRGCSSFASSSPSFLSLAMKAPSTPASGGFVKAAIWVPHSAKGVALRPHTSCEPTLPPAGQHRNHSRLGGVHQDDPWTYIRLLDFFARMPRSYPPKPALVGLPAHEGEIRTAL